MKKIRYEIWDLYNLLNGNWYILQPSYLHIWDLFDIDLVIFDQIDFIIGKKKI